MTPRRTAIQVPGPGSASSDALALLRADHRAVKALFERYKALLTGPCEASDRQALAETICDELTVHATIEEDIFYPAAREALPPSEVLNEAEVEHGSIRDLIADIKAMEPDDELYNATLKVLGEYVEHHVNEEESLLFPQLQDAELDLVALGAELAAMKDELTAHIQESAQS